MRIRRTLLAAALAAIITGIAPAAAPAAPACRQPIAAHEPPCNPHLASPEWSAAHRASYAQASSPFPGPAPGQAVDYEHAEGILGVPIVVDFSAPYADGGRAVWFSTVATPDGRYVYKADFDTGKVIARLGTLEQGQLPGVVGGVSGAYNLLDADGRLIVARGRALDVYADEVAGDRFSGIEQVAHFELPAEALCGPDDAIVGITMLHSGHVAFATQLGVVGVVGRKPGRMTPEALRTVSVNGDRCAGASEDDKALDQVSNSIAADERGGVYVVTSKAMYRFTLRGGRLERTWRAEYETGDGGGVRLGDGSGATPTLMGTRPGDDRFVVITDGRDLMHLVLMWRHEIPPDWKGLPGRDRRIACEIPVTFGDPDAQESLSEQSVAVRGTAAVVVNNKLRNEDALNLLPPATRIIAAPLAGQDPANAPYGIERFDWDRRTRTCSSTWANREVSIPNGIPSISTATGLVYGIEQRDGVFGLAGLDLATGEQRLRVESSARPDDNSFYAATTIGPEGTVWTGTFTGFTIFRPRDPLPPPPTAGPFELEVFHLRRPVVKGSGVRIGCRARDAEDLRLRRCTVKLRARDRGRTRTIARGSERKADRRSFKVRLRLTGAGRRLLDRRPRLTATLVATGTDSAGRRDRVRERLRVRASRRRG